MPHLPTAVLYNMTTGHSRTQRMHKYARTCLAYKYPILFVTKIHNNKVVCFDDNQIDNPNAFELPKPMAIYSTHSTHLYTHTCTRRHESALLSVEALGCVCVRAYFLCAVSLESRVSWFRSIS